MFKYSATQWIFGNEPMEVSLERLKRYGYDGVELAGEPKLIDADTVNQLLEKYSLECTSICGIYTPDRDLSSSNPETRENAVQYVKDCVDLAVMVGAVTLIVVPSPVGKSKPDTTMEQEWGNVVQSLKEAGSYAQSRHIHLAIEALNRFETYLVNKLDDARKLAEEVGLPSIKIMADLFHMNIEERDHSAAIRRIAPFLVHVHIADNTREAAGLGMTNFGDVIRTLIELGYKGPITMEFLPPVANPYLVARSDKSEAGSIYDEYTKQSIDHMKHIVSSI